jgi:uncharacterized SAM-binding protein YcdF (DUF218 family)
MIRRILSFMLLVWALGFAWFALLLPQPASLAKTDAVVVLKAKRMLISGVDRDVKPAELAAEYDRDIKLFDCCIDLGFRSVDTRSNALETARWAARHEVKTLRLVTHDWHMRRARFELDRALPDTITVTSDAVGTKPPLGILFKEYNKYWLRAVASLVGV